MDKHNPLSSDTRRDFLRLAGIGFAGAALAPSKGADAEAAPEATHAAAAFPVTSFGAIGDGKALETAAINRAIEAAAAARGGTVIFPAGAYLSFSIHLKSNVALHFEHGATLIAADTPASGGEGYDLAESNAPWEAYQDYGHNHWHNSLIWGESLENISITGPGLIWGRGLSRGSGPGPKAEDPRVGNKSIGLKNCHNVILRDFSILHGGHFGILATGVDNLTIDNLKIDTNRDGMDIDCCRNVRVTDCSVNSPWDDGICLKSSFALGHARATENVTISGCYVTGTFVEGTLLDGTWKRFGDDDKVPRIGRIKFGTESNGGFKNITVANCIFDGCRGLAIESVDGALAEDIAITNITMRDIAGGPIFLRLGSRLRGPEGTKVGALRRVIISNVVCWNAPERIASIVSGIPQAEVEDLSIHDVMIVAKGGGTAEQAAIQLPEDEAKYPEPNMFGTTPAYGFYLRHVRGLAMSNIMLKTVDEDQRPAMQFEQVNGVDLFRVKAPVSASPVLALHEVRDFAMRFCDPLPDTKSSTIGKATFPAR